MKNKDCPSTYKITIPHIRNITGEFAIDKYSFIIFISFVFVEFIITYLKRFALSRKV